jgi:benzoate-CoA ligase
VAARADAAGLVRPHAFVGPAPGVAATPALAATLAAWAREGLAGYKVPATIELVAELPKTATGKVQRFRLRAGA